jgi:hypothetical protein
MKTTALTLMIALMLSACKNKEHESVSEVRLMAPPAIMAEKNTAGNSGNKEYAKVMDLAMIPPSSQQTQVDTAKKITKEGTISFETTEVNKALKSIIYSVQKAGGYVAEDNQSKDESSGRKEYVLKVRIPSKNFDVVLDTISGTADKIDSKNISIKDISTEYIDIKSRLDNKRKLEARYLALLDKATRMVDILQIEAKVTEIRSDIESTQGQLNYMDKQVAYSSLDITFYSKFIVPVNGDGFVYKLRSALSGGWEWLQSFFFGLISVWPILIGSIALYLILPKYLRARRERKILSE